MCLAHISRKEVIAGQEHLRVGSGELPINFGKHDLVDPSVFNAGGIVAKPVAQVAGVQHLDSFGDVLHVGLELVVEKARVRS